MKQYMQKLEEYKTLNNVAERKSSVFFGADWLSSIPMTELAESIGMPIYNRSLKGLRIEDAESVLEICVSSLDPGKVFISLGENDIAENDFDEDSFCEKYEWLLYTIHSKCSCEIYILSIPNDKASGVNIRLRRIAEKYGCEFIDVQNCRNSFMKFFSMVRYFLRSHPISFCEAMSM